MREIHDEAGLVSFLEGADALANVVVHGVDLRAHAGRLERLDVRDGVLLGCQLEPTQLADLVGRGALVFPRFEGFPFEPWRTSLYGPEELFDAFDPEDPCTYCDCLDARIYRHFIDAGGPEPRSLFGAFAQRLHDHGITDAVTAMLRDHERVVGIMGGHAMRRDAPDYLAVARMGRALAERGFLVTTGGGPGAMEAAHLGVRFAGADDAALLAAVDVLSAAPLYTDERWLSAAFEVRATSPRSGPESLGVPTWFYGHEPPNAFATHIAKYFQNSLREEGLVTIATAGIVFAPGSAGTVQEIFQDACQNHYGTVDGVVSPMALFGEAHWRDHLPVMPLLERLSEGRPWAERLHIGDDPEAIVGFLEERGAIRLEREPWSFCAAYCD